MGETSLGIVKGWYHGNHAGLLKIVADLSDAQLASRPTSTSHSIAFELWHASRANDVLAVRIPRMAPSLERKLGPGKQIWMAEGLAAKWGLDPSKLGPGQDGYGMNDADAAALQPPGKAVLLEYAQRALAAGERAVDAIDEQEFVTLYKSPSQWEGERPIGWFVMHYLVHDNWALGYIAALRRALGLPRAIA